MSPSNNDGKTQVERDMNWFRDGEYPNGDYSGETVVIRRREVIGRGRNHDQAWEDVIAKAAPGKAPRKTECAFVDVPRKRPPEDLVSDPNPWQRWRGFTRSVYTDGLSQDELDIMWFQEKVWREGGYDREIVILRRREVIGRGRTYTAAWNDAVAKAAASGQPAPLKTEIVWVVIGPRTTYADLGLVVEGPDKSADKGVDEP